MGQRAGGQDNDHDPFFAVWLPRTIFKIVWTITPTSFPELTFGIANNDYTKDNRAKEEREGVGQWIFSTTLTQRENLPGHTIFYEHV